MQIAVAKKLTLNGAIVANGAPSTGWYSGSGGSIWLSAGSVAGTGTLTAAGGTVKNDACGGGGRIALYVTDTGADYADFTGTFDVSSPVNGMAPFCGTVYREKKADNGLGELWVKGYNPSASSFPEPMTLSYQTKGLYGTFLGPKSGTVSVGTLRMSGRSRLHIPTNVTLSVQQFVSENVGSYTNLVLLTGGKVALAKDAEVTGLEIAPYWEPSEILLAEDGTEKTLKIANGGRVSPAFDLTLPYDLHIKAGGSFSHYSLFPIALTVTNCTIDAGGAIDVSGRGHVADTGLGKSTVAQTGGSHGGRGNGGSPTGDTAPGNNGSCYGSVTAPITMGSGGRYGTGGGAIKLTVPGTLTVNGAINANGGYSAHYSGAGGSAWIVANRLIGSGTISANGGLVSSGGERNGTGGGGRVSVWLTNSSYDFSGFTGKMTAYGGSKPDGKIYGGPGTVYRKLATEAQNEGTLVIDNGLTSQYQNYECRVDPLVTDADVGTVIVTNNATFAVTNGASFTFRKNWIVSPNARFRGYTGSSVVCAPSGEKATLSGTNIFCNFTCEAPGKTLEFGATGSRFGFYNGGTLTLAGEEGSLLKLVSATPGTQWLVYADNSAVQEMNYLDVSDSDAWPGALMVAKMSEGAAPEKNNRNWNFVNIVEGATNTWTGLASASWSDAGNWALDRAPVATDNIVIPETFKKPELSADTEVRSVTIESGAELKLMGGNLSVRDLTVCGKLTASGREAVTVTRDADFVGGTLEAKRSTLRLAGGGNQQLAVGGVAFRDLVVSKDGGEVLFTSVANADRIRMTATDSVTVKFVSGAGLSAREISFDGLVDSAAKLALEGDSYGHVWTLKATDYAAAAGVTVRDSNASGGLLFRTAMPSTVSNCQNWELVASTFVWSNGAGDNLFTNEHNWAGGVVPGANDDVKIAAAATVVVDAPRTIRTLELGGGDAAVSFAANAPLTVTASLTVATNGTFVGNTNIAVSGAVIVRDGGVITHAANGVNPTVSLAMAVQGNVVVEELGRITACGKGYPASWKGPGAFNQGWEAGPSHGGRGAGASAGSKQAPCYGSIFEPATHGTSGERAGGGVIRLTVGGTLTLDGILDADGLDNAGGWYAGAGGSVWLTAARLRGEGRISANGGNELQSRPGGGGRVAVYLTADASLAFDGKIETRGGMQAYSEFAPDKEPLAAAGTVYVQTAGASAKAGTITVDAQRTTMIGGSLLERRVYTDLPATNYGDSPRDFAKMTLVIKNCGYVKLTNHLEIAELEMPTRGRLELGPYNLTIRSHRHKQPGGQATVGFHANATIDQSGSGRIIWRNIPLSIIIR